MQKFEVIFADDGIVVVNKAPLVPCHPLADLSGETLIEMVGRVYPEVVSVFEGDREGGLCHRIDNNTSGLVVIARDRLTREKYRSLFQNGKIEKTYLAIVNAGISQNLEVNTPIAHHEKNKRKMVVLKTPKTRHRSKPQSARTQARVVLNNDAATMLRVRIEGGRRHQIRVHLASLGLPLLGDTLYSGSPARFIYGHALHAATLVLDDGTVLEAPCPKEWEDELVALGLVKAEK